MQIAHTLLGRVIEYQGAHGAKDIPDELRAKYAQLASMENVLLYDGFMRKIQAEEPAFPFRITTKGLALYSCLHNILLVPLGETEGEILITAQIRTDLCFKLLTALK